MGKIEKVHIASILSKMKVPFIILVVIFLLGIIGYAFILYGGKLVVDEKKLILDATTTIETEDGTVIARLYNENRIPVDINDVPQHVQDAFVAIEDRRFYQHAGVDFKSVMRAVSRDIMAMHKVEGASTITQQLAKNMFLYNDKTWLRKTKEVMAAIYLERNYSKEKLLELYMNQIYFGHGVFGIETAAQKFFSKSVGDLTIAEGALLAGLAKSPNGYSPIDHPNKALERRNLVLQAMNHSGAISLKKSLFEQGKTLGLHIKEFTPQEAVASYVDLVTKEAAEKYQLSINELMRGGYRIVTNIDEDIQQIAYKEFQDDAYFPGNTKGIEGAFIMEEKATGNIIAAIGGRDYQLGELNRVTVKRQPGSTFKPVAVYAPALSKEGYHPYSLLPDQLFEVDDYTVRNADGQYDGNVSLYTALMQSKNTSAVWLLDQIGTNYAKTYLEKMGISLPDNDLAIALGGLQDGVTPLNMAEAYRVLANNGEFTESTTIKQIYDRDDSLLYEPKSTVTEVFTPQVAWNMTEMLTQTVKEGTARAGTYEKALAGKTGTTEHPLVNGKNKDIWFVGYTPEYVSALWIGYDKSDKNHYLDGGSDYPTIMSKKIYTEIDKLKPLASDFSKPEHVEQLPKPITLPEITELQAEYKLGGLSLVKGKLTWTASSDERVVYHIYKHNQGIDERVGEVKGKTEFIISNVSVFQTEYYYVVPYDPLTKMEGKRSELIELSL